jgi:hypothetical protein
VDVMDAKTRVKEWNSAVEQYISSGADKRPADVIKKTSMIGIITLLSLHSISLSKTMQETLADHCMLNVIFVNDMTKI